MSPASVMPSQEPWPSPEQTVETRVPVGQNREETSKPHQHGALAFHEADVIGRGVGEEDAERLAP
eukprot:6271427-Pyramimonas_sp.AAC.1